MDPDGRKRNEGGGDWVGWFAAVIVAVVVSGPAAAQTPEADLFDDTDGPRVEGSEADAANSPPDGEPGLSSPPGTQGLSTIPHVRNLTEGFRIETTFSTFTTAPSDPDYVYIGTSNGLIYTSTDGGKTWDEHHLIKRVRDDSIAFRSREGPSIETRTYSDVVGWPHSRAWRAYELSPPGLLEPDRFRIEDLLPRHSLVLKESVYANFDAIWRRDGIEVRGRTMPPKLGYAPSIQEGGRSSSVTINWLSVHPDDPERVFAMTTDGMFRSTDGGHTWVREYDNPLADRRITYHVNFHPEDPETRLLCSKHGLLKTTDGGETYSKVQDSIIARIGCYYVTFHPKRPDEIWVGTVFGVWVSRNFGETFDLEFYTRVPGQIQIKRVQFDPNNSDNILLGSSEIVFLSRDGGESFERVGVYSFTKQEVKSVMFGREEGHLLVATNRDVWRSTDWGENWQSVIFGNTGWNIQYMMRPGGQSGPLWVLSEAELIEMSNRSPADLSDRELERLMSTIRDEPTMTETLVQALRAYDAFRPELNRTRRKARLSHLLPKLQAFGVRREIDAAFGQAGRFYQSGTGGDPENFETAFSTHPDYQDWHAEVLGTWDLGSLIFDAHAMPTGQNFEYAERLSRSLRQSIQLVYTERRRLQIRQVVDPRTDPRTKLMRELRVEELTELLDIMTRGWFSKRVERE